MPGEERFQGSVRAPRWSKSPERSASLRLFGHGSSPWKHHQHQLQRSGSSAAPKKPPETLRRAVADCLSSAGPNLHGGNASVAAFSESGKTLRDYFAASATTDMSYNVLLEHTLAERDRSPAIVSRCVALLKRYLMRYIPKVETLQQIDDFCANFIVECNSVSTRGTSSVSNFSATTSVTAALPSLPASNYASPSLLKSLYYVQSLVVRYIPKLFQPVSFSGASNTPRQPLPSLSSLLSRSFNSQLNPEHVNSQETSETKELLRPSALNLSCIEKPGAENDKHIPEDIFKWRWNGDKEQRAPSLASKSPGVASSPDVRVHGFLEVGAAALFVGDVESKLKDQLRRSTDATDISDTDRLLQPSTVTTTTSFASASNHLKAITASKRMKPGPHQVWLNVPVSTFHPRTHTLFHYRHYSEQQPLRLNPDEVCDVIAAVCLESCSPNPSHMTTLKFSNPRGKPSTEVAVSVLIKLIIDMYIMDSGTAAPFTLFMLEDMLSSSTMTSRVRVFDIILNLGVHASLLEPMFAENSNNNGEKLSCEMDMDHETSRNGADTSDQQSVPSAIENFESWLLVILYEILVVVVQTEETKEIVWASALSCLLYFICDRGKIQRKKLEGLDIRVMKAFLDISREHSWSEIVHQKLISILANMCYHVFKPTSVYSGTMIPIFDVEQVYLLGGINFICMEYARANLRQEKQDLFLILLDYVCDQINESIFVSGGLKYNFNEIQPLAMMLTLADAPEAFYIAIKHGVEGVGEILRRSVSIALSRSSNIEHLNSLLEKIMRKLDSTISAFTCLDNEFLYMSRITKSYKSLNTIKDGIVEKDMSMKVKLSWSTLHFLLHSERSSYRHNGYIWLVELLLSEIIEGEMSICSSIKILQQHILCAGSQDSDCSSVPIPVSLFCGLLNSKHNFIRWGFLFVLEKFIVRCKLLLDENKLQRINSGEAVRYEQGNSRLEKANTLIDIMSCGLLLLDQKNETDRINILKMCGILFSQLSLVIPANEMPIGGIGGLSDIFGYPNDSSISPHRDISPHKDTRSDTDHLGTKNTITVANQSPYIYESASMAALLLRGHAIVPMQLVARVPTSLLYWPLIQLAGAATDDIALGNAVGSKGCGDLPGGSSDIRAALLLLLNCKCTVDPSALSEVGGKEFFRGLLDDTDSRVSYYSSAFLLKRMIIEEPEKYQWLLQNLTFKAQQSNNEKLLENPYLQMRGILQLLSDLGSQF